MLLKNSQDIQTCREAHHKLKEALCLFELQAGGFCHIVAS